ncbi:hypothetical protein [Methylobacterium planeticum]|nr:hypothetical protein [Methylobacterium planeticum]
MKATAGVALALFLSPGAAFAQAGEAPGGRTGKPANICQELVAFVHPPAPAAAPAGSPAPQAATAVQAPAQGQPAPAASSAAGEPQQKSGLSGPVAQTGPGASGPQGDAQKAAAPAAPPPATAATGAPKPSPEMIEQVDAAARDNNIVGCRDSARKMRIAGVALPAPLLALAALDLKYLQAAQ